MLTFDLDPRTRYSQDESPWQLSRSLCFRDMSQLMHTRFTCLLTYTRPVERWNILIQLDILNWHA